MAPLEVVENLQVWWMPPHRHQSRWNTGRSHDAFTFGEIIGASKSLFCMKCLGKAAVAIFVPSLWDYFGLSEACLLYLFTQPMKVARVQLNRFMSIPCPQKLSAKLIENVERNWTEGALTPPWGNVSPKMCAWLASPRGEPGLAC